MAKREEFVRRRLELNEKVLRRATLGIKRFWNLDEQSYHAGALDAKTKELLGLASSLVLRCDDCITYHLVQACEKGASGAEIMETLQVGLVVGGSIVIPHMRRAVELLEQLEEQADQEKS